MRNFIIIIPPETGGFVHAGALYLADSLKGKYSVSIIDESVEDIEKAISNVDAIAFGISTMSGLQLKNAIEVALYIRQVYPRVPIIWGGAHATALPRQTLQSTLVDYVVWGEGEQSLPLLLEAIETGGDLSKIKGIGYKIRDELFLTGNSGYTPLDQKIFKLPYHLLNMKKYERKMIIGFQRNHLIFSSRGCPYRCRFCSNSSQIWPNTRMRYHTVSHVLNDIKTLVSEYGADGITFGDELFFGNEKRLVEICTALIENDFGIKYRASARIDLLSRLKENTWTLLKEAGFVGLSMGVESGSPRVLEIIGKRITLDQIYAVDKLLSKYQLYKTYNFMTCIPGENIADVGKTLKLILDLASTSLYCPYPFGMELNKYIPLPGTELFKTAVQWGFNPPEKLEDWTDFDIRDNIRHTTTTVRPWLSSEMLGYVDEANRMIEELNLLYTGNPVLTAIDNIRSRIENHIGKSQVEF
ncbi:MAG: B12-binding domain-containing radical SAM protein [Syntrophorhabdaceae bacterium]|nr:B12-binding domain-containing radical SAM protein [Syntrophorhabdaceae bacterium]